MKVKNVFLMLLLALPVSMNFSACSDDTVLSSVISDAEESSSDESSILSFTINSSSVGSVHYETRSVYDSGVQHAEETKIVTLNVYLFEQSSSATAHTDDDYVFYKSYSLTEETSSTSPTVDETFYSSSTSTEGQLTITKEMLGKYVKVVLIANDTPAGVTLTAGTTTLSTFKENAKASVTMGSAPHADVLVGYPQGYDANGSDVDVTGFPMSATATEATTDGSTGNDYVCLGIMGVEMEATLVRTMARIDVFNWMPNLTITDLYVSQTPNASYLFAQDDCTPPATTNKSKTTSYISIYPMLEYCSESSNFAFTPVSYVTTSDDTDEDTAAASNTLWHALYMYEQAVSSSSTYIPTITISYEIDLTGDSSTSSVRTGTVSIPFAITDTSGKVNYVDVERNHYYVVQLGEGNRVTGDAIAASITVADWYNDSGDDSTELVINTYLGTGDTLSN